MTIDSIDSPAALRAALDSIAGNLSFSWIPAAPGLFAELGAERFAALDHNPTALLAELDDDALARALTPEYAARVLRVVAAAAAELEGPSWWEHRSEDDRFCVAYFSCEFGLDESLPIYSGGLGVLSGDHLKSAHELGVPLVAVGLLYREGYFRQSLDEMCMSLNELSQEGAAIEVTFYDAEFDEEEAEADAESRDAFVMLFGGPTPAAIMQVQRDLLVQDVGNMPIPFMGDEMGAQLISDMAVERKAQK